jgi:hypothetical protein
LTPHAAAGAPERDADAEKLRVALAEAGRLLGDAAGLLRRADAFLKGSMSTDDLGRLVSPGSPSAVRWCALGAIAAAECRAYGVDYHERRFFRNWAPTPLRRAVACAALGIVLLRDLDPSDPRNVLLVPLIETDRAKEEQQLFNCRQRIESFSSLIAHYVDQDSTSHADALALLADALDLVRGAGRQLAQADAYSAQPVGGGTTH